MGSYINSLERGRLVVYIETLRSYIPSPPPLLVVCIETLRSQTNLHWQMTPTSFQRLKTSFMLNFKTLSKLTAY